MNPLRIDPTRTTILRASFEADFKRRFASLTSEIKQLLVEQDVFGLGLTMNSKWADETNPRKLANFQQWLKDNVNKRLLTRLEEGFWIDPYVEKTYNTAVDKAYRAVRVNHRTPEERKSAEREFKAQFQLKGVEKLKLAQAKTYTDLKGITQAMSNKISTALIEGLSRGMSPDKIAELVNDRVSKIGLTRAKTLVRTEIVRIHSEATLDAFEALGVKEVGVNVEWATAAKPCPVCAKLRGAVMTIAQARGLFPRHPNCFCSPVPSTKRSNLNSLRAKIAASVREDSSDWVGSSLLKKKK